MEFNNKQCFLTQYFDNMYGDGPQFQTNSIMRKIPQITDQRKSLMSKPNLWAGRICNLDTHPQSSKSMQSPQKELCNAKIYAGKPNYNQLHFEPWRANIISIWTLQTAISPSNHNLSFSKVSGGRNVQPPNLLDLLATPNASAHCNIPFLPLSNR